MNQDTDLEQQIAKLQMSQTLERLYHLAQGCPCDVKNANEFKAALITCSLDLIDALDNKRIDFKKDEDKALFYGLLTVVIDYVMDGQLKTSFKPVTSKH